ncbi:MAG TPA: IclR family transcriptional regulator [Noviherbaspirillum sp.]|nr:IclR family transcriptional regulator [Noviherbaspirillum sp.]
MNKPVETYIAEQREIDRSFGGLLAKGFALLRCFIDEPRPMGNSELSQRLQLPRATVSRLCRTLYQLGYLDWDPRMDKYFVGAQVVSLGYPYLNGLAVRRIARPLMQVLADRIEGAVSLGVAHRLDVTYLETAMHPDSAPAKPDVGATRSVLTTAMGRAFLATLSKSELQHMLDAAQQERPQEYAQCIDAIRDNIANYPKRGFAINEGDAGAGVHGVGVYSKIEYLNRRMLFNCALPGTRVKRGMLKKEIAPQLMEMVRAIERATGVAR